MGILIQLLYTQKIKRLTAIIIIPEINLENINEVNPAQHPKKLTNTINPYVTNPINANKRVELINNFLLFSMTLIF
ncbi:MAG: hypothetical protein C0595_11200 [Marinilabiliales bacterium]|nr:MAG: hypothetical protein C0595_11200 [Marinilabiliales bacterium]